MPLFYGEKRTKEKKIIRYTLFISISFILLMSLFIFSGCAGLGGGEKRTENRERTEENIPLENTGNDLTLAGFRLSFPTGWKPSLPGKDDNPDILLLFSSPGGEITGKLRFLAFDFPYVIERVVDYYTDWLERQEMEIKRDSFEYLNRQYSVIKAVKEEREYHFIFLSYPDGMGIFEYGGLPEDLKAMTPLTMGILTGIRRVGGPLEERVRGSISFHCFTGEWRWAADTEGGFIMERGGGYAGIRETTGSYNGRFQGTSPGEGTIFINNTTYPCDMYTIPEETPELKPGSYALFTIQEKQYCFYSSPSFTYSEGRVGFGSSGDTITAELEELLGLYLSID